MDSTVLTACFHQYHPMSGRMAAGLGLVVAGGIGYVFMGSSKPAEPVNMMSAEQKKSAMLRSRLSGHHPSVSGGADCHSKSSQTGVSLKHLDSGRTTKATDTHEGETSRRMVVDGTVVIK